jgi:hypothetical protein
MGVFLTGQTAQFSEISGADHQRGDVRLAARYHLYGHTIVLIFYQVGGRPALSALTKAFGMTIDCRMGNHQMRQVFITFNNALHKQAPPETVLLS